MHNTPARWLTAITTLLAGLMLAGYPAQAAVHRPESPTLQAAAGSTEACGTPAPGQVTCATVIPAAAVGTAARAAAATATPTGYTPSDLRSAYAATSDLGADETIAVVTAYDDPDAESDMGIYRTQYSIAACTTANGCFEKVNQTGGTTYPGTQPYWSASSAESLDMISAICPNCHIILVEANSFSIADVGTAENEAVSLGAKFIDNDWVTPEAGLGTDETTYDSQYLNHPGVAITAPAGDTGYTVNYPAASPYVTAVGGTTLTKDTSVTRGWTETVWGQTGSGCSAYEPKPSWQHDIGCSGRTLNDVAAVADSHTPVAFYDTPTLGGWNSDSGGTNVAAAIVAALYALGGNPAPGSYPNSYPYLRPGAFNAITSGTNGSCSSAYLCNGGPGYNGPAGVGSPVGAAGFAVAGARPAAVTGTDGTTWVFVRGTDGSIQKDSLASGSSTWSGFSSLGGTWSAYPAAIASKSGATWVFAVSTGGDVYSANLPAGSTTWSSWTDLGNPGSLLIGTPAVVEDTSGKMHVFVRGAGGTLYDDQVQNGTSTFVSLGGKSPDDPAAVVTSNDTIYSFEVGWDTQLYYDKLPSGGSWSGWTALGGYALGVPAAFQDKAGNVRVYVRRAADWDAFENYLPNGSSTWSGFLSLGGALPTDPAAQAGAGGYDWVFSLGKTANLYYDELPAASSTYSGWTEMSGAFTGTPGVTEAKSGGTMYVFGLSTGGTLQVNGLPSGSSTWSGWKDLGGTPAGS